MDLAVASSIPRCGLGTGKALPRRLIGPSWSLSYEFSWCSSEVLTDAGRAGDYGERE
jgi:hypothetical protein